MRIDDTCTCFSQIESLIELNTVMASCVKGACGIRTRDRKFQVERSNHYTIETRHLNCWYATWEKGFKGEL